MTIISGKTYQHKEIIKSNGFKWHNKTKSWQSNGITAVEAIKRLGSLSGIYIIDEENNEEYNSRSHRPLHRQRCEDAPCCGCCGQNYYEGDY